MRWCSRCDQFGDPVDFAGKAHVCRSCQRALNTTRHLARDFGLTDADYEQLLDAQGGVCGICGATPRKQRLHVDHDHRTGVIRGLLCLWCNHRLLGGAREKVTILRCAIAYLESPPAVAVLNGAVVPKATKKKSVKPPKSVEAEETWLPGRYG